MGRGSNKTNSDKLADQLQDERYSLEQETGILTGMRVASGETVSAYLAVGRGARARSSEKVGFFTRLDQATVVRGNGRRAPLARGDGSIASQPRR